MYRLLAALSLTLPLLAGCEQTNELLGLEDQAKKEARQESEGRAVGGACRQSGRAIEDCYAIYSWLPKAAIYAGWRDMDAYMRENKIETVEPQLPPVEPPGTKKRRTDDDEDEAKPVKPGKPKPPATTTTTLPVNEGGKTVEKAAEKPAEPAPPAKPEAVDAKKAAAPAKAK